MIRPLACEDSTVIKDADEWLKGYEGQYFGDYLAKNGYVVFSADAPMWGERGQKEGPRRDRYDMIAGNMMMYGIDLSAWMTYDDIAGTEYLAQMPEVDARRIGCTGWSMGVYRAWMLSALSDRIKVGTAICWMVTTDEQMSFKYSRTEMAVLPIVSQVFADGSTIHISPASPVPSLCFSSMARRTSSSPWPVSRKPSKPCTTLGNHWGPTTS